MFEYLLFLAIAAATAISPGPAVFLAVKNGATYGFKRSCAGILGNVSAMMIMALCSGMGLGAMLLASATTFFVIKVAGGLYLIYLGIKMWFAGKNTWSLADQQRDDQRGLFSIYKEAFLVGISNPKAVVFFTALFPQFIDPSKDFVSQFWPLAVGFALCSFSCLAFYALASARMRHYFEGGTLRNWINRITGGVFVGFGTVLAVSSRQ